MPVDARVGGSGAIAVELVARSAPDGYTLLSLGDNLMLLGAQKRLTFDVRKAFDPVVPTSTQPYILLANLNMPFRSIKELVAYSATQTVTYSGASGIGNTVHLGMERLAQLSDANCCSSMPGTAPAIIAVAGARSMWPGARSRERRDQNR
jgi:tripartite-type tricarboxylate transporter receptor subunit TctC